MGIGLDIEIRVSCHHQLQGGQTVKEKEHGMSDKLSFDS